MEATGTPQPAASPPAAPPPAREKPALGWRLLVALLSLILAFGAAVMIALSFELAEGPRCEQVRAGEEPPDEEGECLDASKAAQAVSTVLTFASGVAGAIAFLLGIYFAFRGRAGRAVAIAAVAAIVLGGLGILIG
jgi:hypothetical protein